MKKQTFYKCIIIFLTLSTHFAYSQTTVTLYLKPNAQNGKDAMVEKDQPNVNYGNDADFIANAWTNGGNVYSRSYIQFDLTSIPANAVIIDAKMSLYCNQNSSNIQLQSHYSGSSYPNDNSCLLQRVTSDWNEDSITWNNQPSVTTLNQDTLPASTSNIEDYTNINVTKLVSDMVKYPASSFGFMMRLDSEVKYRCLVFASSDNSTPDWWPELKVTYQIKCDTSLILKPGPSDGKSAVLIENDPNTNYHYNDFIANAWTYGGGFVLSRSLIQFDLSALPSNAIINNANLSLYCNTTSGNAQLQSYYAGSGYPDRNDAGLYRVTSSWVDTTVTWNTQPTWDSTKIVDIHPSDSNKQDYLNLDVSDFVKDMYATPSKNFGMLFKLKDENYYRCLVFGSNFHTDSTKRPKLDICYSLKTTGTIDRYFNNAKVMVVPTITNSKIYVYLQGMEQNMDNLAISLYTVDGKLIFTRPITEVNSDALQFDINNLSQGLYFCEIKCNNNKWVTKIIKTQ